MNPQFVAVGETDSTVARYLSQDLPPDAPIYRAFHS